MPTLSAHDLTQKSLLPADTMSELAHCYETQVPRVIKNGSIFHLEEVYRAFLSRVAAFNQGAGENPGKFFVEGTQIQSDLAAYFPSPAEHSAAQYLSRLASTYQDKEVLCYGYDFRDASCELSARLDSFMRQFNQAVTYHPIEIYTELFIGRYQMTAGGIHKEEAANFQMVLHGRKTMVVWPEDTWREEREATNDLADRMSGRTELYLKNKRIHDADGSRIDLVGEPGDLIYWPKLWWHVGYCDNFTAAVTVPLYY